jgi:glutamine amidotransferase
LQTLREFYNNGEKKIPELRIGVLNLVNSNAPAVNSVIENLGYKPKLTCNPDEILLLSHLIIPGVGSFAAVSDEVLLCPNLVDAILSFAQSGKPVLGICLGMQFLGSGSEESIGKAGLELLDYRATSMEHLKASLPVPHVGWNQIEIKSPNPLFEGIPSGTDFYFSHSFQITNSNFELSQTKYGNIFTSSVNKENIFGVQFHPERSQAYGQKLLQNFLRI